MEFDVYEVNFGECSIRSLRYGHMESEWTHATPKGQPARRARKIAYKENGARQSLSLRRYKDVSALGLKVGVDRAAGQCKVSRERGVKQDTRVER